MILRVFKRSMEERSMELKTMARSIFLVGIFMLADFIASLAARRGFFSVLRPTPISIAIIK